MNVVIAQNKLIYHLKNHLTIKYGYTNALRPEPYLLFLKKYILF